MSATTAQSPFTVALSLCGAITHPDFPAGDRAELRRWTPGELPPIAYWRLAADRIPREMRGGQRDQGWSAYTHALSLLAPSGHVQGMSLGRALRTTRYHEKRPSRLLNAPQGDEFRADLLTAVRWLSAHREGVDVTELADAFRFGGADSSRERIARGFYT
jgi:CRISPR system Cascade subunit CasB